MILKCNIYPNDTKQHVTISKISLYFKLQPILLPPKEYYSKLVICHRPNCILAVINHSRRTINIIYAKLASYPPQIFKSISAFTCRWKNFSDFWYIYHSWQAWFSLAKEHISNQSTQEWINRRRKISSKIIFSIFLWLWSRIFKIEVRFFGFSLSFHLMVYADWMYGKIQFEWKN